MVAYFRNLHSQFQTVARIMAVPKQTTIQLHTRVIVVIVQRLSSVVDMPVASPTMIGESLAAIRQDGDHVVKPAEEAVQDNVSTVN